MTMATKISLLIDGAGAPRLLRNDFGNSNLAVNVELKGLRTGSGKNNAFGIGARLELRAGEIYQTRVATGRTTHFGLGPHLKADVLRVEWPNGVPQTIYFPGIRPGRRRARNAQGVVRVCVYLGREALPLRDRCDVAQRAGHAARPHGRSSTSAFAPAGASQEYVRIPGDALQPRDGRYVLQFTEELWETAYADEVKLIAVDHPDSVDVFVDERFVPPGPVKLRLFQVARRDLPRLARSTNVATTFCLRCASATTCTSRTSRPRSIREWSSRTISSWTSATTAGQPGTFLFLRGWIYPTDASINVALSQQSSIKPAAPSLEVRDAKGRWHTVIADIGFPSGKDKTIVVDLAGKFPTADHHVRIRTNMQIYWDQAFVARDLANSPAKITTLPPLSADLHSAASPACIARAVATGRTGSPTTT